MLEREQVAPGRRLQEPGGQNFDVLDVVTGSAVRFLVLGVAGSDVPGAAILAPESLVREVWESRTHQNQDQGWVDDDDVADERAKEYQAQEDRQQDVTDVTEVTGPQEDTTRPAPPTPTP